MNNDFYKQYARKNYFAMTGKLASKAMLRKAESGVSPGCAPVGYRNVTLDHMPTIELDQNVAPLIRESFKLAATGKYSLRTIQKIMAEKGLTSRNGKPLGVSALWNILTNPYYAGLICHQGKLLPGTSLVSDSSR